jgi:hypothetical protein
LHVQVAVKKLILLERSEQQRSAIGDEVKEVKRMDEMHIQPLLRLSL